VEAGGVCESIQVQSRPRDRHVGGRYAPLVRAEILFPRPTLPPQTGRINGNPPPLAGGKAYTQGGFMLYRLVLAFAILASATTLRALAETTEERLACTPDAQSLCADEIPDRERVYGCLVRKVNQLSPACKKIISTSIAPAKPKK